MKKEGNKKLALTLVMLGVIISFFGGSLAYWNWETSESQKTMVSVKVQGATLTIEGGNVTHTGMYPTKYCDGEAALIGDVATVTAVNGTESDMEAIIKIRATLSVSQGTLTAEKKSKLNWALIDTSTSSTCSNTPYKGTLVDASTNTDIDTGIRFTAPAESTTTKTYRIYVWLDSSYKHTNLGSDITDPMQNLDISVKFSPASELSQEFHPAPPVLDPGMIPVTIANDGTIKTISASNSSWYDYSNKEWANAVLVNSESRSNYQGTTGKTVSSSDILAYYVWIPRYKYRIPAITCSELDNPSVENNPECFSPYTMSESDKSIVITWWKNSMINVVGIDYTDTQATTDINNLLNYGTAYIEAFGMLVSMSEFEETYNATNQTPLVYTATFNGNNITTDDGPRPIDIVFETKDATKSNGDAVNTYYTHPAFSFGNNEISGIWVGKFETTGDAATPTILPNTLSLTRQDNVSAQFTTSLKFAGGIQNGSNVTFSGNNTYGLISMTDSHMMKNSEWGAVAYLSHSQYGINGKIRDNNNKNYITGCGASEENAFITIECQIAYGSGVTSYPQSTTGNITGVFGMAGGAREYVMGVYSDSTGKPMSGQSSYWNSGFNGLLYDGTTYSSGISFPESKYYDLYLSSQFTGDCYSNMLFCTLDSCGGHALNETAVWYYDYAIFGESYSPWFLRSTNINGSDAGAFGVNSSNGSAGDDHSWRSVLVVDGA